MTRKLQPHNNSRNRIKAPAVIDAAMYLDALQSAGHQVRLILCVGKVRVSGRTILEAVESLKGKVKV